MTVEETISGTIVINRNLDIYLDGDIVYISYVPDLADLDGSIIPVDINLLVDVIEALKVIKGRAIARRLGLEDKEKLARWGKAPTPTPVRIEPIFDEEGEIL